uniref:Apple domain-containing protein n=1 Tax=Acrobeloides nanus TaxID=290746 RepID=A0A914BZQ4_9BILA
MFIDHVQLTISLKKMLDLKLTIAVKIVLLLSYSKIVYVDAKICSGSTTPSFVQLNYQINGTVISSQAVADVFACENLCSSNTNCIAINFNSGQCDLIATSTTLYTSPGGTIANQACIDPTNACTGAYQFDQFSHMVLVGYAAQVITTNTIDECYSACLNALVTYSINCTSGMWFSSGDCILNSVSRFDQPSEFTDDPDEEVYYFDELCTCTLCYTPVRFYINFYYNSYYDFCYNYYNNTFYNYDFDTNFYYNSYYNFCNNYYNNTFYNYDFDTNFYYNSYYDFCYNYYNNTFYNYDFDTNFYYNSYYDFCYNYYNTFYNYNFLVDYDNKYHNFTHYYYVDYNYNAYDDFSNYYNYTSIHYNNFNFHINYDININKSAHYDIYNTNDNINYIDYHNDNFNY